MAIITFPIGAQSQKGNLNNEYVGSCTRSFGSQGSNYVALRILFLKFPPLQGILQLQGPVAISRSPDKCLQDQF